ncbi:hypothetical protein [Empedobacter falsenii]|uniref:hypothetical protein n=1 Tax=Empedobacter falsenii TaxID=343874 RepID=UPI0005707ADA|nr:hypothetical protein [Empedobacter falsenii]
MKKVSFTEVIYAQPKHVHKVMIAPDSYKIWTRPFSETSDFKGDWSEGSHVYFTYETEKGSAAMIATIDENIIGKSIKMRHIGKLNEEGQEIFDGPEIDAWKNTEETYKMEDVEGHTRLTCSVEIDDQVFPETQVREMWINALRKLKEICED